MDFDELFGQPREGPTEFLLNRQGEQIKVLSDGARNQRQLAFRAARQFRKRVEADAFDDSVLQ